MCRRKSVVLLKKNLVVCLLAVLSWMPVSRLCATETTVTASVVASASPIEQWLQDTAPRYTPDHSPILWKFAHPAPPVSLLPPVWQSGFDWLQLTTNGAMTIKAFGGGALYGMAGGVKAIRSGIADYGTCYTVAESRGFELLKTFQVPYVAPANPYLSARIINELLAANLKSEFTSRGVYPAHVVPVRPLTLMSKEPIRQPEDLRGKKVISFMNTPEAANILGYSEVRIPFTEIYTALQQGVVDAVIWVDMGFVPFKIYEQAKFYTEINIAPATIETCFNRQSFDRLPPKLKLQVYDFQQKVGMALVKKTEDFAVTAKQLLKDNSVELIQLSLEDQSRWKKAFDPVVERWMDTCADAGKDCRALVKDIERLRAKYEHLSNEELMDLAIKQPVQGIIDF